MGEHRRSTPTLITGLRLIGLVYGVFVGLGGLIPLQCRLGSAEASSGTR